MKAKVQYDDFTGTVAADISDFLGRQGLRSIGEYFKVDETRFTVVGISIWGTNNFDISLKCVDKQKSTEDKEHIVDMSVSNESKKDILSTLFKRLHIVLHSQSDNKYPNLECSEGVNYNDYHKAEIL